MIQSTIDQATNLSATDWWAIVSGIIGILGFVISVINVMHYFVSRRMNLEIKITGILQKEYHKGKMRIFVRYQANNKSHLPITITDMRLVIDNKIYIEDFNTHEVISYRTDVDYVPTYNEHLPINLPTLSSHAGYLVYVIEEDTVVDVDKGLIFQIRTNRCKELRRKFLLNESVLLRPTPLFQCDKSHIHEDNNQKKFHF